MKNIQSNDWERFNMQIKINVTVLEAKYKEVRKRGEGKGERKRETEEKKRVLWISRARALSKLVLSSEF
jgi:ribosomal protein L19E